MASVVEDRDEILQLLYRYNHCVDSGDAAGYAATFTDDGVLELNGEPIVGTQALAEFAVSAHGLLHAVVNPLIDVDGDRAKVRANILTFRGTAPAVFGTYADDIVRTPDGWRFARRVFTVVAAP